MKGLHFESLGMLFLLWLLPAAFLLQRFASYRRRQALRRFADAEMVRRLSASVDRRARLAKGVLFLAALFLLVVGLARPCWNPQPRKVERAGRDVVFLLDVSRSMLAEDLVPNRLERAKLAILDCIERLQGDRVALVAFAGTSAVLCPLTLDYGFFRTAVDAVAVESAGRGGTLIGDAVRKTMDGVFDDQEKRFKDIVLITDGEDHDSFPVEAAKAAGERGVRIIAVGLGDADTGRRIPVTDASGKRSFLQYQGQEVWARLDADTLRKMVLETEGGRYIPVSTGNIDLGAVYAQLIATAEKREMESKTLTRYDEHFQLFLLGAFLILAAEAFLPERKRRAAK